MGNTIKKAAALCLGTAAMLAGTVISAAPEPVCAADARTLLSESYFCFSTEATMDITLDKQYDGYYFETGYDGTAKYALFEISATRPQFEFDSGYYESNFTFWSYSSMLVLYKGGGSTYIDLKDTTFQPGDKLSMKCRYYNQVQKDGKVEREFITSGNGTSVLTCFNKIKSTDFTALDMDVTCSAKADSAALTLMTAKITETQKDDGSISRSYASVTKIPGTAKIKDGKGTAQINASLTQAAAGLFVSPFVKLNSGGKQIFEENGTVQVYGSTLNPPKLGDITGDGVIDEQDVRHLHSFVFCDRISFAPDPYHVTELSLRTADMNSDKKIDVRDLALLKRIVLKK